MNKNTFDIKSRKEKGSKTQTLVFEGDLSFKNAVLIKKRMDALKITGDTIRFQLLNVDNLDITFIQMIYSLVSPLKNKGKEIEIISEIPEDMKKVLINAGFKEMTNKA